MHFGVTYQAKDLNLIFYILGIVYRSDNNTKDMNDCLNKVLRRVGEERCFKMELFNLGF